MAPRLVLDRAAPARQQGRLEVRWSTEPESLKASAVEYRVSVIAGDEELASQAVVHKEKPPQKAVFSADDLEELDANAKFEAFVRVEAIGFDEVGAVESEEFLLEFGRVESKASLASGQIVRALVEGVIATNTRPEFEEAVAKGCIAPHVSQDKKGFISRRSGSGRGVRVMRPRLIQQVEEDWVGRKGAPGRWRLRVRADGSPSGAPEFCAIERGECDLDLWDKAAEASRKLAAELGPFGFLARVQSPGWGTGETYVRAWTAAVAEMQEAALHGTIEMQSLSGRTLGLIVTPLHPLRLAWHALYDQVAAHARYEQGLSHTATAQALQAIDGAHVPAVLPGADGVRGFLFADTLGFHAIAMTPDGEREPKAAVALMAAALGGGGAVSPAIGAGSTSVLAREILHYLNCHRRQGRAEERLDLLNIQAWRAGDGMTVARALGKVLDTPAEPEEDQETPLCFTLDLYHPASTAWGSGRFLTDIGRRRRSGGGDVVAAEDRWMTETARRPGELIVPRLRWARRTESADPRPSHLSVAFDVFVPNLEVRPEADLAKPRPIHAYGLVNVIERRVDLQGDLEWLAYAPPALDGGRAPENRSATDRFLRLSAATARATARALGGGPEDWPVVATRLPIDSRVWIDRLHDRCDWVVTIDRNTCIEYFDAPRQLPDIYERFVIDAVPERAEIGAFQLITTTKNLDEVRDLVDEALGDMGLSSSERNSRFLLNQLKALSGRLAMRLANPGVGTGELIALALMRACCVDATDTSGAWLDLSSGFLVPVDEIADRAPVKVSLGQNTEANGQRADFIHVKAPSGRGPIEFRFVEVKHRLHLRTVRQPDLLQDILNQTGDLRRRWHAYFFDLTLKPIERALRSSQLGILLQFYADRALRHGLSAEAHARLRREIDALVLKEDYRPAEVERADIGYVFCPEHRIERPERLYAVGGETAEMWLFGPTLLPDERPLATSTSEGRAAEFAEQRAFMAPHVSMPDECEPSDIEPHTQPNNASAQQSSLSALSTRTEVDIMLGTAAAGSDTVSWRLSIRANPHLMIVGLPGMGKTTCLTNICRQLAAARIAPIVFSYHDDIDVSLADAVGPLDFVDYDGLGFNPLRVDSGQATAHVDVAGTLRDIFGSIFSDLGDLQLEELRQAIKQSFDDLGWASRRADDVARPLPPFRAFFDILRAKTKPNAGLVARLQELADYGFFDGGGERVGLLNERRPTIVRVHTTQNDVLQNAFASFVLYSLYKDMFRRGVQTEITHAIVFDEAHRAARLKLIPQFAKECRKLGLSLTLASQEAKDFQPALFSAVGNYLVLRVTEPDARTLARMTAATSEEKRVVDQLKALQRYKAVFLGEGMAKPTIIALRS